MNGFTNAILSLLLGWLRSLFNAVWSILGSDHSNSLITLLREQWKSIFFVLLIGGFAVDRIIYLIRWRPFEVWRERRRIRHEDNQYDDATPYPPSPAQTADRSMYRMPAQDRVAYSDPEIDTDVAWQNPTAFGTERYAPPSAYDAYATTTYAPLNEAVRYADPLPSYPQPSSGAYDARYAPPSNYAPYPSQTLPYAPDGSFAPTASYQALSYQTPISLDPLLDEPRFDDDLSPWNAPCPAYGDAYAPQTITAGMQPAFGTSQPEPIHYLQDVQAGFAPQPTLQQRYNPDPQTSASEPVHPGLDLATFQQNIGLHNPDSLDSMPRNITPETYQNFTPYSVTSREESSETKARGLGALAKKARSLVSGEDERNPRSIRDLQPTVDVTSAFHSPVYPKKKSESENE